MATPDEPAPDDQPPTPGVPVGMPDGSFLSLPQPTMPGEVIPPIPVTFAVGLTDPDVKGHRWAILRASDGTVTAEFRLPWQAAPQIGVNIAQGLAAMAQKASQEANGGLVLPNGGGQGGGLFVPAPGSVGPGPAQVPGLSRADRRRRG